MTPFSPNYLSFQWPTSQLVDPVKRFDVVFGTKSVTVIAMNQTYTAVVKRDGEWWIGWVEQVPGINAQEESRELLLTSLRECSVRL